MEGEIDPDFDPTTEEGQEDINDDELAPLIEQGKRDKWAIFRDAFRRFGDGAGSYIRRLGRDYERLHPEEPVPEYLQMEEFNKFRDEETLKETPQTPVEWAQKRLRELYEHFNFDEVKLSEQKGQVYISFPNEKSQGQWTKPQKLFTQEGEVRETVKALKGFKMASRGLLELLEEHNAKIALQKRAIDLEDQLGEAEQALAVKNQALSNLQSRFDRGQEEYEKALAANEERHNLETENFLEDAEQRYNSVLEERNIIVTEANKALRERDRARAALDETTQELGMAKTDAAALRSELATAQTEKAELEHRIRTLEEKNRQDRQAIEDLERQIEQQREIIADQSRPEEERAAAERELQELQERLEELNAQIENRERELGLTTKEKIKRALLKYGIPAAFAVAIAGTVAAIMSALKGVGAGVKKIGQGLTALGKKMAAAVPGLLGSVLSLVLKTGGELLKFVGNNIWILVVAIGAVLLKKLKI